MSGQTLPRRLGRSDLTLPPLVVGGNVFGWTADEPTSFRVLDRFLDAGLTAIDTADVYSGWAPGNSGGESETVIGRWMASRGCRNRVTILSKVGGKLRNRPGGGGLGRAWIAEAAEGSLRRLQTDRIDLYQAHFDDEGTDQAETLDAFGGLVASGKVRAIGASNFSATRLRSALATSARLGLPRFEAIQPAYNLLDRAFEVELRPLCEAEGIGVVSYYALAAGFLSGKYRSRAGLGQSPRGRNVEKYLNEQGFRVLAELDTQATALATTPARLAIAWAIRQPGITAPIASARTLEQTEDLIAAVGLHVPDEVNATLLAASAPG